MERHVVVDAGNTRTKYGVFAGNDLIEHGIVDQLNTDHIEVLFIKHSASYLLLSSVGHLDSSVKQLFEQNKSLMLLDQTLKWPFINHYRTPETLGKDRVAVVAAAAALYPDRNSLVIDAGTCITYDLVHAGRVYEGGNIAPGLDMRLQAMHLLTARLPQVVRSERYRSIGEDTITAMQAGAEQGACHEMEGYIQTYKKTFGNLNILLTGGDAPFFVKHMKTKIFASPHLVLQGLHEILKYNVQTND